MKKYKVVYNERIPAYEETEFVYRFGIPCIETVTRPSEICECIDYGFESMAAAKEHARIKAKVTNRAYFGFRIEEYETI